MKKKLELYIFFIICSFFLTSCFYCLPEFIPVKTKIKKPVFIQNSIDDILQKFNVCSVGVAVKLLPDGEILYQHNAKRGFIPASNIKLFTALASLAYFGPDYKYTTQLLVSPYTKVHAKVLRGNLYVRFSGDPELKSSQLRDLFRILIKKGIKSISGNVVIDDTALDRESHNSLFGKKCKDVCYFSPATATIVDRNCIPIVIREKIRMKSAAKTHLNALQVKNRRLFVNAVVKKPNLAVSRIIRGILSDQNIRYSRIVYATIPKKIQVLASHNSPNLTCLVRKMLKCSDNLIADSLLKKLGGSYFHSQGTWKKGRMAVQAILSKEASIDFNGLMMTDGSGLFRQNRLTPLALVTVLNYVHTRFPYKKVFIEALPRSGVDGTLKNRLGGFLFDKVRAKTGTLKGVSSLSGYIQTANHKWLAFVILVNDLNSNRDRQFTYHALIAEICLVLATSTV